MYQVGTRSAVAFKVLFKLCVEVTLLLPPHSDCNESENLPESMLCQCQCASRVKVLIQLSPASGTLKLNAFKRIDSFIWSARALVKPSFSGENLTVVVMS